MQRLFALALIIISFAVLPLSALADYSSNICTKGINCEETEVGAFMKGVTAECGNKGNCTLQDIEKLIGNIGNFVLRIVGTALLVMYIYGGFMWLRHGGNSGKVAEGKKIISVATVGFLIVMFAYVGINTLLGIIVDPKAYSSDESVFSCTAEYEGQKCGDAKVCKNGVCIASCQAIQPTYICKTISPDVEAFAAGCIPGELCPNAEQTCCPK